MTVTRDHTAGDDRDASGEGFEHLVSEASENHVAVVGRHDLGAPHPDEPEYLIEITKVDLRSDREGTRSEFDRSERAEADADREAQAVAVRQFLAD
jgi:hypothetical protein